MTIRLLLIELLIGNMLLLSTVYNAKPVLTGKLHWQTKEPIEHPKIIHMYNKYMGVVDCNDQQMKFSQDMQVVEESSFQASGFVAYSQCLSST